MKEILLSIFLLVAVLVVPYILTKVFQTTPTVKPYVENFQGRNPAAVNNLIRGIARKPVSSPTVEPMEVKGVYETTEEFQNLGSTMDEGLAPNSISAAANTNPKIPTPAESSVPAPERASLEKPPMANPYVATPDTESVDTALQPEITTRAANMTVPSSMGGPSQFM